MSVLKVFTITLCAIVVVGSATQTSAQGTSATVVQGDATASTQEVVQARRFPGLFASASAFPSASKSGFVGLTYVNPRSGGDIGQSRGDGDAVAGYTLGNPIAGISVTGSVVISGLQPFGDSGAFNLTASRFVTSSERSLTFVGASANNLAAWGDAKLSKESFNLYASHVFTTGPLESEVPIQVTVGYGTEAKRIREAAPESGVFAGIGVGVTSGLSVSASATQSQFNLGIGASNKALPGVGLSAGILDITENIGDRQLLLSLAYGF